MIDPISNRLAAAGSHEDDYYNFEQVDTYLTAPPKPPHPDTPKYLWPGQTADEEDEEAESDLLMLLGTLKAKVVSDRPVGVKEFYDCLVCADDGEEEEKVWSVMSTWLRKQNKLVEIEEKIEEVKVRGQPTPTLSSAQGKRLQDKLHASRNWNIMERWQQDKFESAMIARSHHKDMGDEDWKRSEVVDQLLEDYRYIARHGDKEILLLDQSSASKADSSSGGSDDESMHASTAALTTAMMRTVCCPSRRSAVCRSRCWSGTSGGSEKKGAEREATGGSQTLSDYMKVEPKLRPLHTYTLTINLFLNLSAQRSSPHTTALSLTPLNSLMALLYPRNDKLQAMVKGGGG